MDIVVALLIGAVAVVAWLLVAMLAAIVAGRMIRERDAHDRPAGRRTRVARPLSYPR